MTAPLGPALGSVLWNPPAAALGAHNALISDSGAKRLEPFVGPLSLKHMLRGSPHHFHRSFRAIHGRSPQRYLSDLRLARAQRLLRDDGRSVTEICAAVGFESLGTFSALFRRETGRSPRAYRLEFARSEKRPRQQSD